MPDDAPDMTPDTLDVLQVRCDLAVADVPAAAQRNVTSVEFRAGATVLQHLRLPDTRPAVVILTDIPTTRRVVLVRALDTHGHPVHEIPVAQGPHDTLTITVDTDPRVSTVWAVGATQTDPAVPPT